MPLYALPLVFALIGLAFYAVLAGADFGSGFWTLTAGRRLDADKVREHARSAIAPVWEANHVWLIFVITVVWTAYPLAFGSIASTLSIPLFLAAVGIILRGMAYALRAGIRSPGELRRVDSVFSIASILTPFALGLVIGGIASGRVPVGNAAGSPVSSWLNPISILIGVLAVVTAAYTAAVFLAADAARTGDRRLEERFRRRALASGAVAGTIAIAGLAELQRDAHRLFTRLIAGPGLPALVLSIIAGVLTLVLVWRARYEPARYTSALAVAAIIFGWALAQAPQILPGLTIKQAAAPHDTQVAVVVAVIAGGIILFPSLALLFKLTLAGQLVHADEPHTTTRTELPRPDGSSIVLQARVAAACLVVGIGLLTLADTGWAHAVGLASLFGFVILGFRPLLPPGDFPDL